MAVHMRRLNLYAVTCCQNDALGKWILYEIAEQKQINKYLVHKALKEYVRADISAEIL